METDAERQRLMERRQIRSPQAAEKRGETLIELLIADHNIGLGGRFLLSFTKRGAAELPWNRFRVGSPVIITPNALDSNVATSGVVSKRTPQLIQVATEEWPEGDLFRLDMSSDEVTRARQLAAMNSAMAARGRHAQLRDCLLGVREPQFDTHASASPEHAEAPGNQLSLLNESQRDAVRFALSARDLAIIHGPPGTGKTTTVVQLALQAAMRGEKVLACAPSNTAVDNLLERLARYDLRVVRIGHPARVHEDLQAHTLDALVERDPAMALAQELMRDAEQLARQGLKSKRAQPEQGQRQAAKQEIRRLREDARRLERQVIASYLDRADIICATTTLDPEVLGDRQFDLTIIDEACQSTEPGCWPVVHRSGRLVLAGDHLQLPPTVLSVPAADEGYAVSLMERLVKHYGDQITRQLTVQYRMHHQIMDFSSELFYGGSLLADASVRGHRLSDLPDVISSELTRAPLQFIDTAGAGWDEQIEPDGESRFNAQEARAVVELVGQLRAAGCPGACLAVIAPYAAQVRLIKQLLTDRTIEVDTVDGFQGREKEAVIISLVRSNSDGEIGFLGDTRRMNVAMTRARRKLIILGDSATLGGHTFYAKLLDYFEKQKAYSSVWEHAWSNLN